VSSNADFVVVIEMFARNSTKYSTTSSVRGDIFLSAYRVLTRLTYFSG
jgi:hypothetical protein